MLHLALVQNLLSAIGAAPHFARPNFPQPASHYPAGVHLTLLPFGEQALRHFMFLERPEGMALRGRRGAGRRRPGGAADVRAGHRARSGQDFATVGHLYRSIEAGIRAPGRQATARSGCSSARRGPRPPGQYFRWPELVAVTDVAVAQQAIDEILEQGEGAARALASTRISGSSSQILDEFRAARRGRTRASTRSGR